MAAAPCGRRTRRFAAGAAPPVTVIWRAAALADAPRIARHIAAEKPIAARKMGRELLFAGDSLALFLRRSRPGRELGTRQRPSRPDP